MLSLFIPLLSDYMYLFCISCGWGRGIGLDSPQGVPTPPLLASKEAANKPRAMFVALFCPKGKQRTHHFFD